MKKKSKLPFYFVMFAVLIGFGSLFLLKFNEACCTKRKTSKSYQALEAKVKQHPPPSDTTKTYSTLSQAQEVR